MRNFLNNAAALISRLRLDLYLRNYKKITLTVAGWRAPSGPWRWQPRQPRWGGVIHGIQVRQFLLEGVGILVIVFSGLLFTGMMFRWSDSLKKEVAEKTRELKKREYQYRSLWSMRMTSSSP